MSTVPVLVGPNMARKNVLSNPEKRSKPLNRRKTVEDIREERENKMLPQSTIEFRQKASSSSAEEQSVEKKAGNAWKSLRGFKRGL